MSTTIPRHDIFASRPTLRQHLSTLHALSRSQSEDEAGINRSIYPKNSNQTELKSFHDKLVALDQDKSEAMYLLLRAINAQRIFEAGTSFGVSTMYLIAAMRDNIEQNGIKHYSEIDQKPRVWGTENEESKANSAKENISKGFSDKNEWDDILKREQFELLFGDIVENIAKERFPKASIDALLLDSMFDKKKRSFDKPYSNHSFLSSLYPLFAVWAPVALPTLKGLSDALRPGAIVLIDNSRPENTRYAELHQFLDDPSNGWKSTVLPFDNGFEMTVKVA